MMRETGVVDEQWRGGGAHWSVVWLPNLLSRRPHGFYLLTLAEGWSVFVTDVRANRLSILSPWHKEQRPCRLILTSALAAKAKDPEYHNPGVFPVLENELHGHRSLDALQISRSKNIQFKKGRATFDDRSFPSKTAQWKAGYTRCACEYGRKMVWVRYLRFNHDLKMPWRFGDRQVAWVVPFDLDFGLGGLPRQHECITFISNWCAWDCITKERPTKTKKVEAKWCGKSVLLNCP